MSTPHGDYINDLEAVDGGGCVERRRVRLGIRPRAIEANAYSPGPDQDDTGRSGAGADQDDAHGPGRGPDQDHSDWPRRRSREVDPGDHGSNRDISHDGCSGSSGRLTAGPGYARPGGLGRHSAGTAAAQPQAEPAALIPTAEFGRPNTPSTGIRPGVFHLGSPRLRTWTAPLPS